MKPINIKKEHLDIFYNEKKNLEQGLSASAIYAINNCSISELKAMVALENNLPQKLTKTVYGGNLLIFSILNTDPEVFKYVYQLYRDNNIDISKFEVMKSYRKKDLKNKSFYFLNGENLIAIALKADKPDIIDFLFKNGHTSLVLPLLPEDFFYHKTFNTQPSAFTYFLFSALTHVKNSYFAREHGDTLINKYINLSLSLAALQDTIEDKEEYLKNKLNFHLMSVASEFESTYKDDYFRKELFPLIFIKNLQNSYYHFNNCNVDSIFKYYTRHTNKQEISAFKAKIEQLNISNNNHNTQKFIKNFNSFYEKFLLNDSINEKKEIKIYKI